MIKNLIAFFLILIGFLGCATVQLTEKDINIMMARNASCEGPSGISDKFTLEGKIVAYVTFKWDDVNQSRGIYTIESKWYSGDKLVHISSMNIKMGKPPHYAWFNIGSTGLGIGKARVEIYSDGLLIGKKDFEVVDKL
jgi:hypothetical protein